MASDLKGRKVLIFGANGYIGRHLAFRMIQQGAKVIGSDIQDYSLDPAINYIRLDTTNLLNFSEVNWNIDFVFIFSGTTGTHSGFDSYEKFIAVNEIGLLNILTSIKNSSYRPRIVFPSSRLVYKGSELPLKETDEKEAKTIYAVNKLACEQLLHAFKCSFDIDYTIYRICIPYANAFDKNYSYGTIGFFLNQAINNSSISLYGDGSLRRSFTHINDICHQILNSCASDKSINETYNLMGEDYSLKEIAMLIADKFHAGLNFIAWPDKELRIESGHTVFDGSKLAAAFSFELEHGITHWLANIKK